MKRIMLPMFRYGEEDFDAGYRSHPPWYECVAHFGCRRHQPRNVIANSEAPVSQAS